MAASLLLARGGVSGRVWRTKFCDGLKIFGDNSRQCRANHCCTRRHLHVTPSRLSGSDDYFAKKELQEVRRTELTSAEIFEAQAEKNKDTFKKAIDLFSKRDVRKRGAVEFIRAALKNMRQFGVHKDLEIYRALIDILPKAKYVPETWIQTAFFHYPKQQECIVDVLSQMQDNRVTPDVEMGKLIEAIFGDHSLPFKKYMRMMYWLPKFKNLSPWPLPFELPQDTLELAKLAIARITSIDILTEIKVLDCSDIEESIDKTWIVSGQSPEQKQMIRDLPKDKALYVEGAFRVWLQDAQVNYFILRGEPVPRPPPPEGDSDDVANIKNWVLGEVSVTDLVREPNKHEQVDGSIFACCATGTSSKDSLLSWIRFLQRDNPDLEEIPILFVLSSPLGQVIPVTDESFEIAK